MQLTGQSFTAATGKNKVFTQITVDVKRRFDNASRQKLWHVAKAAGYPFGALKFRLMRAARRDGNLGPLHRVAALYHHQRHTTGIIGGNT